MKKYLFSVLFVCGLLNAHVFATISPLSSHASETCLTAGSIETASRLFTKNVFNILVDTITITSGGNFCVDGTGYLRATVISGVNTKYKWQRKAVGALNFVDVTALIVYMSGDITYTTPMLSKVNSGDQYRVVILTKKDKIVVSAPVVLNVLECNVPTGFHRFPNGLKTCARDAFRNLEKVFNTINGANWNNKSNWFTEPDLNKWYGVTMTDDSCDVKSIKIPKNLKRKAPNGVDYIVGLPQSFKGSLNQISFPGLEELDLSGNNISFQIYDYNFPKLKILNLSNNNLSGNLPPLADLPSLQELYLNDNKLEGNVPAFILKLKKYDLRNNKFMFSNLSNLAGLIVEQGAYSPQALIPLNLINGALVANTNSKNNANGKEQYTWLNNGDIVLTTTANNFVPTTAGNYTVAVSHSSLTVVDDADRNLVLTSNDVKIDVPMLENLQTFAGRVNKSQVAMGISPNPATNEAKITFSNFDKGEATLNVYDVLGRLVVNKTINSFETTINISNFASGSYIVEIASNGEKFRDKLVKE